MSIKFEGDLKTLIVDLEARGYEVRAAEMIAGSPGRTADIYLHNGAVVQWDAYSHRIWATGPASKSQRTERFLRYLYEGGVAGRLWITTIWALRQSFSFLRKTLLETTRIAAQKIAHPPASPPPPPESTRARPTAPYSII